MIRTPAHKQTNGSKLPGQVSLDPPAKAPGVLNYMDTINHPEFRVACALTHQAEKHLIGMGMTLEQAREWIRAWVSGAGDGIE